MRLSRLSMLLGCGALALAIPVLAQGGPESLLPEGFGAPTEPPPARPSGAAPTAAPGRPSPTTSPNLPAVAAPAGTEVPGAVAAADNAADAEDEADQLEYDLPATARRSLASIGLLKPEIGGLPENGFGSTSGIALSRIMQATRAPFVSRWGSILLRRALLSQTRTPADINGADWIAARAWLLLRMGEADNARTLIQGVDADNFTRKLYAVAMQAQLASADPAGFCPLLPRAREFSDEPSWFMAQAICASFAADQGSASAFLGQAERRGIARGIDYRLAEKVVGAGPNSRRSVKIEWDGVGRLTTWRYGLATAANVEIPAALYGTVGPQVRAWEAQAPALPLGRRLAGAQVATRLGVFSGQAALGFYDQLVEQPDADSSLAEVGDQLRDAYRGDTIRARVDAMHGFWSRAPINGSRVGPDGVDFGALPVIARAAAAIPPTNAVADDAPWLIAAMLSGGFDRNAARWQAVADRLDGPARERSWALLVTGLPRPSLDLSGGRIDNFIAQDESESRQYAHMLVAALAGLDRLPRDARARLMTASYITDSPRSKWGKAILAASARGEQATVAVLAAVGMQASDWAYMPPEHLYLIVSALRRVGLDPYARMIASEAMARL